jgi:hypothetical protein
VPVFESSCSASGEPAQPQSQRGEGTQSGVFRELVPDVAHVARPARGACWLLRYKLSLRGLPELFVLRGRGMESTYEAVRDWEATLTSLLIDNLCRRWGGAGDRPVTVRRRNLYQKEWPIVLSVPGD